MIQAVASIIGKRISAYVTSSINIVVPDIKPVLYSAKFLNKFDLAGICVGMAPSSDMGACK